MKSRFSMIYEDVMKSVEPTIEKVKDKTACCNEAIKKYKEMKGQPDENKNLTSMDNLTKYNNPPNNDMYDFYEMRETNGEIVSVIVVKDKGPKLLFVYELMAIVSRHGYGSRLLKAIFDKYKGMAVLLTQDWSSAEELGKVYEKCGMTPVNTTSKDNKNKIVCWYYLNGNELDDVKDILTKEINSFGTIDAGHL